MCRAAARAFGSELLTFGPPRAAVRGGRAGPAGGIGRTPIPFRRGRSPVEKPGRHSRTGRLHRPATRRGCPSLWLLSLGQARESDPASGRRSERPLRKRPGRDNAKTKRYRNWTPACAGVTAKEGSVPASTRPSPRPSPRKGEGAKAKESVLRTRTRRITTSLDRHHILPLDADGRHVMLRRIKLHLPPHRIRRPRTLHRPAQRRTAAMLVSPRALRIPRHR